MKYRTPICFTQYELEILEEVIEDRLNVEIANDCKNSYINELETILYKIEESLDRE